MTQSNRFPISAKSDRARNSRASARRATASLQRWFFSQALMAALKPMMSLQPSGKSRFSESNCWKPKAFSYLSRATGEGLPLNRLIGTQKAALKINGQAQTSLKVLCGLSVCLSANRPTCLLACLLASLVICLCACFLAA